MSEEEIIKQRNQVGMLVLQLQTLEQYCPTVQSYLNLRSQLQEARRVLALIEPAPPAPATTPETPDTAAAEESAPGKPPRPVKKALKGGG